MLKRVSCSQVTLEQDHQNHSPNDRKSSIWYTVSLWIGVTIFVSAIFLHECITEHAAIFLSKIKFWENLDAASISSPGAQGYYYSDFTPNNMTWLLRQSQEYGKPGCHLIPTTGAYIFGLGKPLENGNIQLPTDEDIDILVVSYGADGNRRCTGGDFYETDISGLKWKSRPPLKDIGDGSYIVKLRLDYRFSGLYTFKVNLLFANLHGLDLVTHGWMVDKAVFSYQIEFVASSRKTQQTNFQDMLSMQEPKICTEDNFKLTSWRGRWTRATFNESCTSAGEDGRHRCLDPEEPCETPWCEGPVGILESNGWVYSAHCAFRLFKREEAWNCLNGRWIFSWGDSNHQDTFYNLVNFILGRTTAQRFERDFDFDFTNPNNASQLVRITHKNSANYDGNRHWAGLSALDNDGYREGLRDPAFLPGAQTTPDTMIMNSGLHDGLFFQNVTHYVQGVQKAVDFWHAVWRNVSQDVSKRPKIVYRTTVAPAGISRGLPSNPHKMEVYNTVVEESMIAKFGNNAVQFVDDYDITFPWHYDNNCSDGGHYGRPPALHSWQGIITGHQYFVDLMLGHVLLNVLCPASA